MNEMKWTKGWKNSVLLIMDCPVTILLLEMILLLSLSLSVIYKLFGSISSPTSLLLLLMIHTCCCCCWIFFYLDQLKIWLQIYWLKQIWSYEISTENNMIDKYKWAKKASFFCYFLSFSKKKFGNKLKVFSSV